MGYTQHLMGNVDGAIESYHQALGIKPDDSFSGEMLDRALEDAFDNPTSLVSSFTPRRAPATVGKASESRMSFGAVSSLRSRNTIDNSMLTDEGSSFTLDSDVEMT